MIEIGIISIHPDIFRGLDISIPGRAQRNDLLRLHHFNPRDFSKDKHRTVDDKPYGGGPGMVMLYEPLQAALEAAKQQLPDAQVIFLSPKGEPLQQQILDESSQLTQMIILCGRYEGIDQRIIDCYVDREISLGDYVLSGGELAAMVIIDGITRLLPDALGDPDSATQDSFVNGLLDCPHYSRPAHIDGMGVPEVLLSGHHQAIKAWRFEKSLINTWQKRPDLIKKRSLTTLERRILDKYSTECTQES